MKCSITEKGKLKIVVPANLKPEPSKSGKTLLVATSHGFKDTEAKWKDKTIRVNMNAYTYPTENGKTPRECDATAKLDGKTLTIFVPMIKKPEKSDSGKSYVVASSGGNGGTEVKVGGKTLIVGVTAICSANGDSDE